MPTPLNTSKALVLLTKNLKISANQAFNTMNDLYLNKIISYPRTDSDVYKDNFDHVQYLKKFSSHSQFGNYTTNLLALKRIRPTKGRKDAGDHPPITPLESLELNSTRFENDLQKTGEGSFVRMNLDIYIINNGQPGDEDKKLQVQSEAELIKRMQEQGTLGGQDDIDPKTGLTYDELNNMDISEIWELMKNRR